MFVSTRSNTTVSLLLSDIRRSKRGGKRGPAVASSRTIIDRKAFFSPLKNAVMIVQKMILQVLKHTKGWKVSDIRTITRPPTADEAKSLNARGYAA
jgi:hypothetical protein